MTVKLEKFSSCQLLSTALTAASLLAKLTNTSCFPVPRLSTGCSPSLQNWRKCCLVAVYLINLLSVKVRV